GKRFAFEALFITLYTTTPLLHLDMTWIINNARTISGQFDQHAGVMNSS
ncbi:MAG: hypothetical protein ACI87Q_003000, partial [Pseudohongiellaceae bacterium]